MAADVSYVVRLMNGYKDEKSTTDSSIGGGKSTALITRDLLGGGNGSTLDSTELDLDLQVPMGWEKCLDLKSGKVYLQKCDTQTKQNFNESFSKLQDLNYPPPSKQPLSLFDESSIDLKLVLSSSPASSSSPNYQSVCTLDKVKSALERAERETNNKRSASFSKSSSPALSNSSSSIREMEMETKYEDKLSSSSFAAGCPSCLLYVLISRNNPRCPHCHVIVPSSIAVKKPQIDLNISM